LRLSVNVQKPKVFQLQGGFASNLLPRGSAPGPRWGSAPDPLLRLIWASHLYWGGFNSLTPALF